MKIKRPNAYRTYLGRFSKDNDYSPASKMLNGILDEQKIRNENIKNHIIQSPLYTFLNREETAPWSKNIWTTENICVSLCEYEDNRLDLCFERFYTGLVDLPERSYIVLRYILHDKFASPIVQVRYEIDYDLFQGIVYHYYPQLNLFTSWSVDVGMHSFTARAELNESSRLLLCISNPYLAPLFSPMLSGIVEKPSWVEGRHSVIDHIECVDLVDDVENAIWVVNENYDNKKLIRLG